MLSKYNIILHMHNVHYILWVLITQKLQDFQLNPSLIHILFLVFYELKCYFFLCFVVYTLQSSTKTSFSKKFDSLISITNMVAINHLIISIFIVVSKVVFKMRTALNFLNTLVSNKVYLRVLKDFSFLKIGQLAAIKSKGIKWRHRKLRNFDLRHLL